METGSALLCQDARRHPSGQWLKGITSKGAARTKTAISLSLSPPGFVEPLDLHTCYTPWPVFRDVTDGTGLYANWRRCSAAKGPEVGPRSRQRPAHGRWLALPGPVR